MYVEVARPCNFSGVAVEAQFSTPSDFNLMNCDANDRLAPATLITKVPAADRSRCTVPSRMASDLSAFN